jgi:hypothetical protein
MTKLARFALGAVLGVTLMAQPAQARAGGVTMEHSRVRVWGVDGYGVRLVIRDFWDRPTGGRLVRTPNGQADIPWDSRLCNGPCRVEIERELTEAEFMEIRRPPEWPGPCLLTCDWISPKRS